MKESTPTGSVSRPPDDTRPFESLVVSAFIVQKCLNRALDGIYLKSLDARLPSFSVTTCVTTVSQLARLQLANEDPGEVQSPIRGHCWLPSQETVPLRVDVLGGATGRQMR